MHAEIHFDWTLGLVTQAQRHFLARRRHYPSWIHLCFGVFFGGLFAVSAIAAPFDKMTWFFGILSIFFVAIVFLPRYLMARSAKATIAKWGEYKAEYTISDEGVRGKGPYGENNIPWGKMEALWQFPDMWLLLITKRAFFIFPTAALTQGVREFIVLKVRENGGKVK